MIKIELKIATLKLLKVFPPDCKNPQEIEGIHRPTMGAEMGPGSIRCPHYDNLVRDRKTDICGVVTDVEAQALGVAGVQAVVLEFWWGV